MIKNLTVIKKDGTIIDFDNSKIINAVSKSAERVLVKFTKEELNSICKYVNETINKMNISKINVSDIHCIVESALDKVNHNVAISYRVDIDYKKDFEGMHAEVNSKAHSTMCLSDKSNSNTESA